jgi:hypothetical protein
MPQLTKAAIIQGLLFNSLRWAYQANVIKTLLQVSNIIDIIIGRILYFHTSLLLLNDVVPGLSGYMISMNN